MNKHNHCSFLSQIDSNSLTIHLKIVPNSSRTKITGLLGDRLKITVAAPPEAGKANKAVIQLLAKTLDITKNQIEITAGHTQPQKTVHITGLSIPDATARLQKYL